MEDESLEVQGSHGVNAPRIQRRSRNETRHEVRVHSAAQTFLLTEAICLLLIEPLSACQLRLLLEDDDVGFLPLELDEADEEGGAADILDRREDGLM